MHAHRLRRGGSSPAPEETVLAIAPDLTQQKFKYDNVDFVTLVRCIIEGLVGEGISMRGNKIEKGESPTLPLTQNDLKASKRE